MRPQTQLFNAPIVLLFGLAALAGCGSGSDGPSGGTSAVEDVSASGAAAQTVGAALGGSSRTGTMARQFSLFPQAFASNDCPTIKTSVGSGCVQTSSTTASVTYDNCNFGNSKARWSGVMQISLSSTAPVTCGTFPVTTADGQMIQRQFVASGSGTTPASASRTNSFGTVVTFDDASPNLSNFDSQTISPTIGSGYGSQVIFNASGARRGVVVAKRLSSSKFDHSVNGTLAVSEYGGIRTISLASIKVYHNLMKVVGTASFTNVVFNDSCAGPVGGTITTTFAAGANATSPTAAGAKLVGKSETLTFNGCDNQILVDTDGTSTAVSITGA